MWKVSAMFYLTNSYFSFVPVFNKCFGGETVKSLCSC